MNFTNNYEILQNKVIVNAKKPQTFTGVLVKRTYNNGFDSYYTLTAISIDGTGVTFYWQNTINALAIGTYKCSLFPGVVELSEIS